MYILSFCSTNKERTCYTGALCGLGWNGQTNEAIFPEDDIELTFDVKFDVEDITEVTAVFWLTVVKKYIFFLNCSVITVIRAVDLVFIMILKMPVLHDIAYSLLFALISFVLSFFFR